MAAAQSQRLRRVAQKASRRKAIVAEKHKAGSTMSGREALQIIGAARAPVRTCVMAERLFADGIGWVVLARTLPSGHVRSFALHPLPLIARKSKSRWNRGRV